MISERNRVLTATLMVQALNTWGMLAIAAIAPMVAEGLGLAAALVGYQLSLIYLVASATSLVAGAVVGRWGPARASQASLLACAAGVSLAAAGGIGGVLAASVLIGFGYGLTNPASSQLLFAHSTAEDRSLVFSIKQTGVPLGGALAGLVTPALALGFGWQAALAAIAPPALALALVMERPRARWDAARRPGARLGAQIREGTRRVLADARLRALCLAALCFAAIQLSLMGFVVTFAVTELGFGAVLAGVLLAVVQGAGATGRLGWGWLADRLRRNAGVLAAIGLLSAAGSIGFALIGPGTPVPVVFALAVLFGVSAVGWNGVFLAEVARLSPPPLIGAITGVVGMVTFAGVVIGPAAFSALHALLGSFSAAYLGLTLIGLAGSALILRQLRRAPW